MRREGLIWMPIKLVNSYYPVIVTSATVFPLEVFTTRVSSSDSRGVDFNVNIIGELVGYGVFKIYNPFPIFL
jgi:hypothetical protein